MCDYEPSDSGHSFNQQSLQEESLGQDILDISGKRFQNKPNQQENKDKLQSKPPRAPYRVNLQSPNKQINRSVLEDNQCSCEAAQQYQKLMEQYSKYKQKVVEERQKQLAEFIKYREHLDRNYKQIQSKFEQKIQEDRKDHEKRMRNMQKKYQQKIKNLEGSEEANNHRIDKLREELQALQIEKLDIIEKNTEMLYQISGTDNIWADQEEGLQKGLYKNSYQQLVKLYQFVLEENNSLKKQLYRTNANNTSFSVQQQLDPKQSASKQPKKRPKVQNGTKTKKNNSLNISKSHNQSIKNKPTKRK